MELWAYSTLGAPGDWILGCYTHNDSRFRVLIGSLTLPLSLMAETRWTGWPPLELTEAPRAEQKAFQTCEMNWGPWSEMMSDGIPCRWNTCCTINFAVSWVAGNLARATKWPALEKRSTMVSMILSLLDGGSPVTKSKAMWDQGRVGTVRGHSISASGLWEAFPCAHIVHAKMKALLSASMEGHQKCLFRQDRMQPIPGWQANKSDLRADRVNRFAGPLPGSD